MSNAVLDAQAIENHQSSHYILPMEQHEIVDQDHFNRLLQHGTDLGVSDFYIITQRQIRGDIHNTLEALTEFDLPRGYVTQIAELVYGGSGISTKLVAEDVDCSYQFKADNKTYRYRVSMAKDIQGILIVMRPLPARPPRLQDIGMDKVLIDGFIAMCSNSDALTKGKLFIIAGSTGSGKSTSIASLITYAVEDSPLKTHGTVIYTAEAPVEYSYNEINEGRSIVRQFEQGKGFDVFSNAIRSFMRKKPHIINIGETRDYETLEAILQASNTGHVAITTIHANSVAQIVTRMVDLVPANLRTDGEMKRLLESIGIAIFQKLIKRKDGKRVALREYLIFTPEVQDYLIAHRDNLTQAVQTCVEQYGRSSEKHLAQLVEEGVVDV